MREQAEIDRPAHLWQKQEGEEEEDPFVALGQMVKLAGIGIWRRVSMRDKRTRPEMQKRSNSDSILEISRPVSYTDAGDELLVELVEEDTCDDKTPLPQTETTTRKAADEEVVLVSSEVAPMVSIQP
jgi:hypothetical protein